MTIIILIIGAALIGTALCAGACAIAARPTPKLPALRIRTPMFPVPQSSLRTARS
jgi:hypothetical protein